MDELEILYNFINDECDKLFKKLTTSGILPDITNLDDIEKRRSAFYFYILKNLNDASYEDTYSLFLFDNHFLKTFKNTDYKDFGIDACFISYQSRTVYFYNFKFRESLCNEQDASELRSCKDFFDKLLAKDSDDLEGQIKVTFDKLITILEQPKKWNFVLNYVTNEKKPVQSNNSIIKEFKRLYKVKVVCYSLTQLSKRLSTKPTSINCKFVLANDDVIKFSMLDNNCLVCKMRVLDMFRAFCDDEECRTNFELVDYASIKNNKIDENALFDNPRGDLQNKEFIDSISSTLYKHPEMFFAYNNGITVITNNMENDDNSFGGQKIIFELNDAQIVNGGQTIRACGKAINSVENLESIKKAYVLVRIFNINEKENLETEDKEKNLKLFRKIPEFTNKQVKISDIDLKAMDYIQILIERKLAEHRIFYCRRNQKDHNFDRVKYDSLITMEKFGQILYSVNGNPHKASQKKKAIFGAEYDTVFNSNLDIDQCYEYAKDFTNIAEQYKSLSQQKTFYIIYIKSKLNSFSGYDECIEILDDSLNSFVKEDAGVAMKDSRKLILEEFKDALDTKINEKNQISIDTQN